VGRKGELGRKMYTLVTNILFTHTDYYTYVYFHRHWGGLMMLNQVLLLCFQVETIRAVLKKELDLPIIEIGDESAKLDGGDVLFTGTDTALVCSSRCVNFQIFIQGRKRNALCGGCVYL